MALSSEESRRALFVAVSKALDSYERGKLDPVLVSSLLEQLQVVLEAVAANGDSDDQRSSNAGSSGVGGDDINTATEGGGRGRWPEPPGGWGPQNLHQEPLQPPYHKQPQQGADYAPAQQPPFPRDPVQWQRGALSAEQRRLQQLEAQLEGLQQENQRLQRQVGELSAAVAAREVELQRPQERGSASAADLGNLRLVNEAVKQQLADSRAELAVAAASRGGASRAEAVLMAELEQQRQVAATLRRELQKVVAAAARDKEALSHEVRHWQLAANQAANVAERAQQKVTASEQRLEAQADQVRLQAREAGALQQQLAAGRASLATRTAQLERLNAALLQPLLAWHVEADPAVAPSLVAGIGGGAVGPARGPPRGRGGGGSSPPGRQGALARGGAGAAAAKFRSEVAAGAAAVPADSDPAVERQVQAAIAAFEALRSAAQQAKAAKEQLKDALDAKSELREALAAERATAELRAAEVQQLADTEARLALQVEELAAELSRVKIESAEAIKAAQEVAEEVQSQRAAAAFERGRQAGDRQAAVAVAALRGELQDHALTLQRERELCERAVADARRAGELAAEQARRECELAVAAARREGELTAAAARREGELAAEAARQEAEAAVRKARGEVDGALEEAKRERDAALQRVAAAVELESALDEARCQVNELEEELQRTEEQAAEALAKSAQYLKQVYAVTQELERAKQDLAEKDAQAEAAAKEHEAATAELEAKLCECRQRLATQAEQLEQYASQHDSERALALESLRARLEHVSEERDSLQAECVALRQQLSGAQAAAAGVEVEIDALTSALEAHKAARAAAEGAADEARRSAAAATAAAEEAAGRLALLSQQLQEAALVHQREMGLLEARCAADLDAAQARYQAELEALQARLKMLRLKQSRVMAYVDDVFFAEEQDQQGAPGQRQPEPEMRDRDQSPRWERQRGRGRGWDLQLAGEGRGGWIDEPEGRGGREPAAEAWSEDEDAGDIDDRGVDARGVLHREPDGGGSGESRHAGARLNNGRRRYGAG